MRIDSGLIPDARIQPSHNTKLESKTPVQAPTSPVGDTFTSSGSVQLAQKLECDLGNLPDVRRERVAALRSAIQKGEWTVTPDQIAGAIYREIAGEINSNHSS